MPMSASGQTGGRVNLPAPSGVRAPPLRGTRTTRLPWREIAKIAVTSRGPAAGYGLVVTTRTGRRSPLPAPTFGALASDDAMMVQVEAIVARAGAHRDGIVLVPPRPWGRRMTVVGHVGMVGVLLLLGVLVAYLALR